MDNHPQEDSSSQVRMLILNHPRFGEKTYYYSPMQTLSELRPLFQGKSQLYLFSNYYLEHKGQRLPQYEPLAEIITQEKAKIDIVLNVFDYRSAKHHLARVMEIIYNPQFYLYLITADQTVSSESTSLFSETIPEWVKNFNPENLRPDLGSQILISQNQIQKKIDLLYSLSLSGFNPAPASQRLNGDLFYIHARSLQGHDLHITASPYGFYLNQSRISSFNPNRLSNNKNNYISLIDLFKSVSEKFHNNLQTFLSQTKLTQAMKYKFHSLQKIRKKKWLDVAETDHGWNNRKILLDSHVKVDLMSLRDWNQSFQAEYKMAQQNGASEVQKKAQLNKIYSQFQAAALQGACYLVDGKISPLNPTDDKKKHIYIYNKIFFSIANETVYDHSQEKGEDATPSSSSINTDLINIETLYQLDIPDLHVLHMVVVNYRGFKVIAQCIIPGILSVDQLNCSQYGSIDDGKTIQTNPEFEQLMIKVCDKLGLESDIKVKDGEGVVKRIAGSPDIKGILGSDKRKYILDLLRLSPRDLNYQGSQNQTCVVRRELLKKFMQHKGKQVELPKINVNIGTDLKFQPNNSHKQQQQLLKQIAQFIKLKAIPELIQSFKTNPSKYLTDNYGVSRGFHDFGINLRYLGYVLNHEQLKNQHHIRLVLEKVICVRSMKHLIRMAMRQSNIMHLGMTITNMLNSLFGKKCHLIHLQEDLKTEYDPESNQQKQLKKKKKKKVNNVANKEMTNNQIVEKQLSQFVNVIKIPLNRFANMKPSEVWEEVCKIAKARYNHDLPKSQIEFMPFILPFLKASCLRDLCLSTGIVLERKNYDIVDGVNISNNDKALPFTIKNIASLDPIPKHMNISPPNLFERQKQSDACIDKFQVKDAFKIDSQLEKEHLFICGGISETGVKIFSRIGKVLYVLGDNKNAITQEEKNLVMLESISSQDFYLTIQSHLNLGVYNLNITNYERVIYHQWRATYLMLISYGETAPDLLVSFANLSRAYSKLKDYNMAIKCYQHAMEIIEKAHGKNNAKMSFCYSSLASICYETGNMTKAIEYQTANVAILKQILPGNDYRFLDGIKILQMYRDINLQNENKMKDEQMKNVQQIQRDLQLQFLQSQVQEQQHPKKKKGKKN